MALQKEVEMVQGKGGQFTSERGREMALRGWSSETPASRRRRTLRARIVAGERAQAELAELERLSESVSSPTVVAAQS
jgi:hypothetical protein